MVKKRIKRLKNIDAYKVYDGLHPAIITEEEYGRVQEIRISKQPAARVKDTCELQNAFAGLLYCAKCGKRIGRTVGSQKRGAIPRVRCVNARNCHNASAGYEVVEAEIIRALRLWLSGYKVKIETTGYAEDIALCKKQLNKTTQELDDLNRQLENAFELVEKGVYTIELFQSRRDKLNAAIEQIREKQRYLQTTLNQLEQGELTQNKLIPKTEMLLDSYDAMTNQERNDLLKEILSKIEYRKEGSGSIEIDLYPRLPHMSVLVGIID